MKSYETILVCNPNLTSEEISSLYEKIKTIIAENKGEARSIKQWGKRRLAYRIKDFQEGIYLQINFDAKGDCIEKIENYCRINENILRFLTVKIEKKKPKIRPTTDKTLQE